jgi:hypothetical protein
MILEEFGKVEVIQRLTAVNSVKNNSIMNYLALIRWNDPILLQRCNHGMKLFDSVRLLNAETSR